MELKKNFLYNAAYQLFLLLVPFVTTPYISRILGAEGVGVYSYTFSVVNYFMLFSLLGIKNYGNRVIAKTRGNRAELSREFWHIYMVQLVTSLLMLLLYVVFVLISMDEYRVVALLQIPFMISVIMDVSWFFFGMEKFKMTTMRSILTKVVSLVLIFLLVRSEGDVWIYTLIMSSSALLGQIVLVPALLHEVDFVKIVGGRVKKHILPILVLFIPVVAISIYKVMDKIMLGIMSPIEEVGYYEQAEKVVNMPLGIITALGTVMMPRISNLIANHEHEKIKEYMGKAVSFMMFMAFPTCFGLLAVADQFVVMFLGDGFMESAILVKLMAVTILFIAFANVIRTQHLIPYEKDRIYIWSVVGGALLNVAINLALVPVLQAVGACIGTIFAEAFVMAYQTMRVHKEVDVAKYLGDIAPFLVKSVVMYVIVTAVGSFNIDNSYLELVLQIFTGVSVYLLLNKKYVFSIIDLTRVKRIFSK